MTRRKSHLYLKRFNADLLSPTSVRVTTQSVNMHMMPLTPSQSLFAVACFVVVFTHFLSTISWLMQNALLMGKLTQTLILKLWFTVKYREVYHTLIGFFSISFNIMVLIYYSNRGVWDYALLKQMQSSISADMIEAQQINFNLQPTLDDF